MTEDKVVKFEEIKSEWPAAVAVEEAGDECVAKAEGNRGELVDNSGINFVVVFSVCCQESKQ